MSGPSESKRTRMGAEASAGPGVAPKPRTKPRPAAALAPGLYLVATPIGNAADITLRALDVLKRADVIAAEDTRQTRKLMNIHGIPLGNRPIVSYHDQNGAARRPQIEGWLEEGCAIAYCSDAGMPLIADPGFRLVEMALAGEHAVTTVPGASAVLTALSLSGLPNDRFLFAGFLPVKAAAKARVLAELGRVPATLIFFENPRRLAATLAEMTALLGPDRQVALARELTKRFEEVRRGTLGSMAEALGAEDAPKGEMVLMLGPPPDTDSVVEDADIDAALAEALETLSVKDAAREVATRFSLPRRDIYARALEVAGK